MPKKGRGKYDALKVVPWYIEFIRTETEKKLKKKLEQFKSNDSQIRLNNYRADEALLNLLERQRKLIPAEGAVQTWKNEALLIKRELLGIPNKVAHKCLTAQSKSEINEIIINAINEALEKYANGTIDIPSANTGGDHSPNTLSNDNRTKDIPQTKTKTKRK